MKPIMGVYRVQAGTAHCHPGPEGRSVGVTSTHHPQSRGRNEDPEIPRKPSNRPFLSPNRALNLAER